MMQPIRTALFAPGNRPERVEKALLLSADIVVIDLEDAVPLAEKESTRPIVRRLLDGHPGRRIYVRINALSTPYAAADLQAVVSGNLRGIMVPKVESPDEIFALDELLSPLEGEAGLEKGALEVIPLCETARGLEEAYRIASARPERHRILTIAFGAADYTLDLGIHLTREGKELEYPRARLPVACRAGRVLPPLDSPWMFDLKDTAGLLDDIRRAKAFGFMGKIVIHPRQIQPCHDLFTPSAEEIAYARKVIAAFEEAERAGRAALQLEGKFIDYPVVERSRQILALARAMDGI
ncbi:MAG: CoA ester lyase [Deltaproteobacteria bacterium]|nr:CoA ester lyase [Deltaproteobacteria bacterium]